MATNTPNINLVKPDYTDNSDIGVLNANSDKIDTAVKTLQDLITALQTSTKPQAILNAIKTIDGIGSGLDSDFLDGKHAADFHPNLITLANVSLNNYKTTGKFYFSTGCSDLPSGITEYVMVDVFGDGEDAVQIATSIYFNKVFTRTKLRSETNWQGWKEIGGGNLFTVPRQFSVANTTAGQTVFSYSGGSGEVNTLNFADNQALIIIDGVTIDYPNFPYSGSSGVGWHMNIKISFKNSVEIKTKLTINAKIEGLVMTEK